MLATSRHPQPLPVDDAREFLDRRAFERTWQYFNPLLYRRRARRTLSRRSNNALRASSDPTSERVLGAKSLEHDVGEMDADDERARRAMENYSYLPIDVCESARRVCVGRVDVVWHKPAWCGDPFATALAPRNW